MTKFVQGFGEINYNRNKCKQKKNSLPTSLPHTSPCFSVRKFTKKEVEATHQPGFPLLKSASTRDAEGCHRIHRGLIIQNNLQALWTLTSFTHIAVRYKRAILQNISTAIISS